jgi:hypothetical protein
MNAPIEAAEAAAAADWHRAASWSISSHSRLATETHSNGAQRSCVLAFCILHARHSACGRAHQRECRPRTTMASISDGADANVSGPRPPGVYGQPSPPPTSEKLLCLVF